MNKLIKELMVSTRIKALIPAYEDIHEKVTIFEPMLSKMIVIEQRLKKIIDNDDDLSPDEIDEEVAKLQELADELGEDYLEEMEEVNIAERLESKMGMIH
jgi:hypothetical protein